MKSVDIIHFITGRIQCLNTKKCKTNVLVHSECLLQFQVIIGFHFFLAFYYFLFVHVEQMFEWIIYHFFHQATINVPLEATDQSEVEAKTNWKQMLLKRKCILS